MNARHIPEQVSLFAIANPSRTASEIEVLRHAAIRARDKAIADGVIQLFTGIGRGLAFLARAARNWPNRYRTYENLRSLSDRELADIGLTRGEISRVFEPDFRAPAKAPANMNTPRQTATAA